MKYKQFEFVKERPIRNSVCICWLSDDTKVTADYRYNRQVFIGKYDEYEGVELEGVEYWTYAIIPKRQSHRFEDMLVTLSLPNGDVLFTDQYSRMSRVEQDRLYNETELISTAIGLNYNANE